MQNGRKMLQSYHKHTRINLLMGGFAVFQPIEPPVSPSLNPWRGQIGLSQMCLSLPLPPSLVTPSLHPLLFHNAERSRPSFAIKGWYSHHIETHTHTHLEPKLVSPGTCANSLTDWPTISPRVTWSCVGSVCFPVVEMTLIHVNN